MKIDTWQARTLITVAIGLFRVWAKTLRFQVEDREGILSASLQQPFILSVWHNRLILLAPVCQFCFPHRRTVGLISASRDGDFVSALVKRFGHGTVRGSSSRQGVVALRQLADALAAGDNVLITPDGPRGPVYEVSPGVIFVAQKSGAAIVPMHLEFGNAWRLSSWDRFFIPKPFSKVRIIFGAPERVNPKLQGDEFEQTRLRLQETMMKLVEDK